MIFKYFSKQIVYNFFGSLFDKLLPLIVTAFLTKFISVQDFNNWHLFYQYLIFNSVIPLSTITTRFSRLFYESEENKMSFDNYGISILVFVIITVIYLQLTNTSFILIQLLCVVSAALYGYFTHYLRFSLKDNLFLKYSAFRFFFFLLFILIFALNSKISFLELLISLFVSTVPFLFIMLKHVKKSKFYVRKFLKEDITLLGYGVSSSSINGADRFVIGYFLTTSSSFIGFYSIAYTIANLPTLVTEAIKKTLNPIIYKELSESGKVADKTKLNVLFYFFIISVVQFIFPFVGVYILEYLNLINPDIIQGRSLYTAVIILSVGLVFHAFYQIITPIYFFYQKSIYLLCFQAVSFLVYLIIISLNYLNEMVYYISNSIMLIMIFIFTLFMGNILFKRNLQNV